MFSSTCLYELQKLRLQENSDDFVDMKIRALNDRLMLTEKGFLDVDGLRGRQWFRHLVSVFAFNVLLKTFINAYEIIYSSCADCMLKHVIVIRLIFQLFM